MPRDPLRVETASVMNTCGPGGHSTSSAGLGQTSRQRRRVPVDRFLRVFPRINQNPALFAINDFGELGKFALFGSPLNPGKGVLLFLSQVEPQEAARFPPIELHGFE